MAYKINGSIIIDNSSNVNAGVVTATNLDGKVSEKAITEQTDGDAIDVTGADEVLVYDGETNGLLRVSVDEFIGGSGIGTIVSEFNELNVTGVVTASSFDGNLIGDSTGLHNGDVYSRTGAEIVLEVPLDTGTGELKANVTGETVSVSSSVTAPSFYGSVTGNVFGDTLGDHDGDVYSRDGSQLVLEVPATSGDAHYIGTVTGDVTGDTTGTHFGTNTGQQHGDVYTADGSTQVIDTAAVPAPVFKGDAEGLTGTPNISVGNVSVGGSIIPTTNIAYDLGSDTNRFRDLYLEGNTIFLGEKQLSADTVVTSTAGVITASGFETTGIVTAASFHGDGSAIDNIGVTGIGFGLEYNYSSNTNLPGTQSGTFRLATTGFFQGLAIHEDDLSGVDQSSFFEDIAADKRYTIYMEYAGGTCFYSGLFFNFDTSLYTFFNGELTGDLPANGTPCKLMIINEVGRSVFTQDFRATGISSVANLTVSGITTMSDHLIIDDGTGLGTEYALNVRTSDTSRFGVLGNGAILLGNSSAAPFIATNDHHATSKKFVDDAVALRALLDGTNIPGPFNNDTSAATGGVPVGGIYKNSNGTIHWRTT